MSDLRSSDRKNVWHPFSPLKSGPDPILIESASGVYLYTHDGRKIIDAVSSWWVNLHGHSNPVIAEALAQQARKLEHVIFAGFTHEPAIKLSENLLSILPDQSKVFFSDNGSTAVEVALKMAIQYWKNQNIEKKKIIAIEGAYHGDTFGSMSVGDRGLFTAPFTSYLFDVEFISFPDERNENIALKKFQDLADNDDIAAFIFEPLIQAAAGMRMYSSKVLDQLTTIARAKKIVCIADEVFTGFGRTGKLFASDHLKNKPDIMSLSKGLTGGTMPLGVTTCNDRIAAAFETDDFNKTFFHGHSYTANPLACAAANASFNLLMDDSCARSINRIARSHEEFMMKIEDNPVVKNVRTLGTILAIELQSKEGTSYDNALRKKIYPFFVDRGVLLRPLGNIIYIVPPYVITNDELKLVYSLIEEFLRDQ